MKKPLKVTPIKNKVWSECKRIIRKTYQLENGMWRCFTCDRLIDEPAKAHTGHFLASSTCGALLRYDLRNLRVQCYFCNINAGGNSAEFYVRLVKEKGQEYVDQLFLDKQKTIKADAWFYQEILDRYKLL